MHLRKLKTLVAAAVALVSLDGSAQDLLASQAPIDRTLKSVDSLSLKLQLMAEDLEYPAFDLYEENWDTRFVNAYKGIAVPDSFRIDLTGYAMPTESRRITSKYGYRWRRMHRGLDVKVYVGDTIRSAFDGKVRVVKYEPRGYGKYVVIRHPNGLETVYGHLSKQIVKVGDIVKAGEPIGLGGNTGRSTGSHLHFETRFLGIDINPIFMFDFENQDIVCDSYLFVKDKSTSSKSGSSGGSKYYRVRSGDSLSKIAARQGTTIDRLCRLNGITRKTILRPGQMLKCS